MIDKINKKAFASYSVCALSGALLGAVFAGAAQASVAWFALVPLLVVCRTHRPAEAARHGFAFGLPLWIISIWWMAELRNNGGPFILVILGLFGLGAYCAGYIALFAAAASKAFRNIHKSNIPPNTLATALREIPFALALSMLWCGAEYLRSTLFTGFAWNALGVTQVEMLPVAQLASLGGVYAVSFMVALFNAALAGAAHRIWRNIRKPGSATRRHFDLMLALALLLATMTWGARRVAHLRAFERAVAEAGATIAIGAVNPEMPCIFQTDDDDGEFTASIKRLSERTTLLAALKPDLIIWPETVLYDTLPSPVLEANMADFTAALGVPILAGGTQFATDPATAEILVYNASFLFGTNGHINATYAKQHLVPFGEYIPFDKTIKILQRLAPTGVSVTPGHRPVLMEIAGTKIAPQICFEDTVAGISRHAVLAGADILIAQSNDAWFKGSTEAWQHHRQAVFRAIENARPLVRCSNNGVMSVVSSYGLSTEDADGSYLHHVPIFTAQLPPTPYTRHGDLLFGIPCALALWAAFAGKRPPRKTRPPRKPLHQRPPHSPAPVAPSPPCHEPPKNKFHETKIP